MDALHLNDKDLLQVIYGRFETVAPGRCQRIIPANLSKKNPILNLRDAEALAADFDLRVTTHYERDKKHAVSGSVRVEWPVKLPHIFDHGATVNFDGDFDRVKAFCRAVTLAVARKKLAADE